MNLKSTAAALVLAASFTALAATLAAAPAAARDVIRIVGSSTVYPFATVVAERFGRTTKFRTPVVESTGTGGGFKIFCAGVGDDTPDISDASRAIKPSEVARCKANGVGNVVEVKIGYDGIVLANSKRAPQMKLSLRDIFLALARNVPAGDGKVIANPYRTWADVNADLPATRIEVMGPPPTSGTRDAFAELAMEGGCKTFAWIKALKKTDKSKYKAICHAIREDGAYIEAGENDNLIVGKLEANPDAMGVFGFSYLDQNREQIQATQIQGVNATFENIADGSYPLSRPLFFYVKTAHLGRIPGLKQYARKFISDAASGPDGYLIDRGLIPMSAKVRRIFKQKVLNLRP